MDLSHNNPYQSDVDVEEYYQTAISKLSKEKIDAYHQLTRDNLQRSNAQGKTKALGGIRSGA